MAFRFFNSLILLTLTLAISCGAKVESGRNGNPSQWPVIENDPDAPQNPNGPGPVNGPSNGPGNTPGTNGPRTGGPTTGEGNGNRGPISACFQTGSNSIAAELAQFCKTRMKPIAQLSEINKIVCEQGKILAVLNQPHCGWDGNPQTVNQFMHTYYMQTDKSRDYEDIVAGFTRAQVPVAKFILPIRLAFENFDEFKSRGFQWVAGTREHKNLNHKKWEEGIEYRFRADKGTYEIGYQGINHLYQITPTLFVHINYATSDFERISHFAQVGFHQLQPDQSTVSFRIEHRRISSQGLYERAKKSAAELSKDVMEKGYKNAIK